MKIFGPVLLFLLLVVVIVILWALFFIRKIVIKFKQHLTGDYDEETFQRMANKHYRGNGEGPKFDKDYFKGTGSKQYRPSGGSSDNRQQGTQQQNRTTTTTEGTTIIDGRPQGERKKKIFAEDEGEYVEFTEE